MSRNRRRAQTLAEMVAVEEKPPDVDGNDEALLIAEDDNSVLESEIARIRRQWELASVLNFLVTFEPVIGSDLKLTAEEIENGLVKPDSSLARLHIKLLKGIPPVSKTLNDTDAWVTALCKKIADWWPWVAEGELPLTAAKGEEICKYKNLEPTIRLKILKALCEIRADQHDVVDYINSSLKSGSQISCFRKSRIGGDGNATSYWYDGGTVIGHRLYREVSKTEPKSKLKGKASNCPPAISLQWETLATNLNEFQKIVDELSSSKVVGETAVGKIINTDVVPEVEKFHKKKERALKQKQRQERLLNDFRSYGTGATRSCRSRRAITYTFDEYDRAIDEAIEISKKRKSSKEISNKKQSKQEKVASESDGTSEGGMNMKESHSEVSESDTDAGSQDGNTENADASDSKTESDSMEQDSKGDDSSGSKNENDGSKIDSYKSSDEDEDNYKGSNENNSDSKSDHYEDSESENSGDIGNKPVGTRTSKRLGGAVHEETRNMRAKTRLRQRPTRNSAYNTVVPDSEDNTSGCDDSEDVSDA